MGRHLNPVSYDERTNQDRKNTFTFRQPLSVFGDLLPILFFYEIFVNLKKHDVYGTLLFSLATWL